MSERSRHDVGTADSLWFRCANAVTGRWVAYFVVAGLLWTGGCATSGGRVASGGTIESLHLFGLPIALELDGRPGPDGIGIRLFASAGTQARGVSIQQGTLEILLFEGTVPEGEIRSTPPRKVWALTPANLRPYESETSLGVGYQLALRWENLRPRQNSATVVARYRTPGGKEIYSDANAIPLTAR